MADTLTRGSGSCEFKRHRESGLLSDHSVVAPALVDWRRWQVVHQGARSTDSDVPQANPNRACRNPFQVCLDLRPASQFDKQRGVELLVLENQRVWIVNAALVARIPSGVDDDVAAKNSIPEAVMHMSMHPQVRLS